MLYEEKAERGGLIQNQNGKRRISERLYEVFQRNIPPAKGCHHGLRNANRETGSEAQLIVIQFDLPQIVGVDRKIV